MPVIFFFNFEEGTLIKEIKNPSEERTIDFVDLIEMDQFAIYLIFPG